MLLHQVGQPALARIVARTVHDEDAAVARDRKSGRAVDCLSLDGAKPVLHPAFGIDRTDAASRHADDQTRGLRKGEAACIRIEPDQGFALREIDAGTGDDHSAHRDEQGFALAKDECVGTIEWFAQRPHLVEPLIRRKPAVEHRNGMDVPVGKEHAIDDVTR